MKSGPFQVTRGALLVGMDVFGRMQVQPARRRAAAGGGGGAVADTVGLRARPTSAPTANPTSGDGWVVSRHLDAASLRRESEDRQATRRPPGSPLPPFASQREMRAPDAQALHLRPGRARRCLRPARNQESGLLTTRLVVSSRRSALDPLRSVTTADFRQQSCLCWRLQDALADTLVIAWRMAERWPSPKVMHTDRHWHLPPFA